MPPLLYSSPYYFSTRTLSPLTLQKTWPDTPSRPVQTSNLLSLNTFTLVLEGCDKPFSIDDSLKTTTESYIINEYPTCSDGCIPTFYTHQDVLYYTGAVGRSGVGSKIDISCANYVQSVALAYICNGLGNVHKNMWGATDGDLRNDTGKEE